MSQAQSSRVSLVNSDRNFLVELFKVTDLIVHREKQGAFFFVIKCYDNVASSLRMREEHAGRRRTLPYGSRKNVANSKWQTDEAARRRELLE
ncbi:MAG: hypothetical protein ABSD75_24405 [Terriglobales bacterium]|jgi:hypothetical protein